MKILYFAPCLFDFPKAEAMVREAVGVGTHAATVLQHGLDRLRIACANGGEEWCWVDQAPLGMVRRLYGEREDLPEGATPNLTLDSYELHVLVIPDLADAPWQVSVLFEEHEELLEAAGFE